MFFKKKPNTKQVGKPISEEETLRIKGKRMYFSGALENIHLTGKRYADKKEYLDYLEFITLLIRKDIALDQTVKYFYEKETGNISNSPCLLIPFDLDIDIKGKRLINLQEEMAVSFWEKERLYHVISMLKDKLFWNDTSNHKICYIEEFQLAFVEQGFHSLCYSHYIGKEGEVEANIVSIKRLFDEVDTDGGYWYKKGTKEYYDTNRKEVEDFKIALLFELTREIQTLKSELEAASTNQNK